MTPNGIRIVCDVHSRVTILTLSNQRLVGQVPSDISKLNMLQSINLSYNSLTGEIDPIIFQNMVHLEQIHLINNNFSGDFGKLNLGVNNRKLSYIDITKNNFEGSLESLLSLYELQFLIVSYNRFSGSIPSTIGRLSQLKSLKLGYNQFTGPIPTQINYLEKLKVLELQSNSFQGSIPTLEQFIIDDEKSVLTICDLRDLGDGVCWVEGTKLPFNCNVDKSILEACNKKNNVNPPPSNLLNADPINSNIAIIILACLSSLLVIILVVKYAKTFYTKFHFKNQHDNHNVSNNNSQPVVPTTHRQGGSSMIFSGINTRSYHDQEFNTTNNNNQPSVLLVHHHDRQLRMRTINDLQRQSSSESLVAVGTPYFTTSIGGSGGSGDGIPYNGDSANLYTYSKDPVEYTDNAVSSTVQNTIHPPPPAYYPLVETKVDLMQDDDDGGGGGDSCQEFRT